MTFLVSMDDNDIKALHMGLSDMGDDSSKINLFATIYRNDALPLMEGCNCYTCSRHTKAYINHLLSTHEMLAQTLLEIHNTHHFLEFFQDIRYAHGSMRDNRLKEGIWYRRKPPTKREKSMLSRC